MKFPYSEIVYEHTIKLIEWEAFIDCVGIVSALHLRCNGHFDVILQCLGWSWYLANDMQFYVISPLVLFLVYR